jgi:hypothetical protein
MGVDMGVMMDSWWCLPTKARVRARAAREGIGEQEALERMLKEREELILRSREDPYNFVTEPGIWLVCDAIMDFPWCSELTRAMLFDRLNKIPALVEEFGRPVNGERLAVNGVERVAVGSGSGESDGSDESDLSDASDVVNWGKRIAWEDVWAVFKRAMRRKLGFVRPARHLLISGTNRSSKSNYCVSRAVRFACEYDWRAAGEQDVRCYFMHESHKRVVEDQMSLIWHYLPKELRAGAVKDESNYVSYKPATGFSNDMFMTPNGIKGYFRSYEQETEKALEGFTAKMVVAEENVPLKWADRIFTRLSDKNGWYLQPFTPIHGWTATVGVFQSGMIVTRDMQAYVLPEDMGPPEIATAVGLTPEEFEHVERCKWTDPPRQAQCPRSRPEDCVAWLDVSDGSDGSDGSDKSDGRRSARRFERVPRVARCVDERKAVVWFGPMDNPYSDAADVIRNNLPKGREEVLKCVYGVAVKSFSAKFARFSRDVHVVAPEAIPAEGLNGLVVDPAGTRNWAMAWYRVSGGNIYFYREFPSPVRVTPGAGVMGLWAENDDRNGGVNDGRKGAGQEPLGWSYLRYKAEIARLEGWKDYVDWEEQARGRPDEYWNGSCLVPTDAEVEAWDEDNGSAERTDKIGDVRALSTPKQEKDRFETMQTILDEIGLRLDFADGVDIEDAVGVINHLLDFERSGERGRGGVAVGSSSSSGESDGSDGSDLLDGSDGSDGEKKKRGGRFLRAPQMFVSAECVNLICALENWQNADGLKGAYKDFVDLVRYAVLRMKKPEFMRRGVTVLRGSEGRARSPGVGRGEGGRVAVGSGSGQLGRVAVGSGSGQYERVMGAGGRCVMRVRRR